MCFCSPALSNKQNLDHAGKEEAVGATILLLCILYLKPLEAFTAAHSNHVIGPAQIKRF